jgi:Spy/CpxP family protein refolding chaperone
MRWRYLALLGLVVMATTAAVEAGEQNRRPHRWWQSDEVKTLLELTDEQSATLDTLYRRSLPKRRESMHRLDAEEQTLSRLIGDMDVEEIDITRQIDRVEGARSELSKTRLLLVFRMHRVLTEPQRATLNSWMTREPADGGSEQSRTKRR